MPKKYRAIRQVFCDGVIQAPWQPITLKIMKKESWEEGFDKGVNKILKKYKISASATFLIVFSKDFIRQLLLQQEKKIIKEYQEAIKLYKAQFR